MIGHGAERLIFAFRYARKKNIPKLSAKESTNGKLEILGNFEINFFTSNLKQILRKKFKILVNDDGSLLASEKNEKRLLNISIQFVFHIFIIL